MSTYAGIGHEDIIVYQICWETVQELLDFVDIVFLELLARPQNAFVKR